MKRWIDSGETIEFIKTINCCGIIARMEQKANLTKVDDGYRVAVYTNTGLWHKKTYQEAPLEELKSEEYDLVVFGYHLDPDTKELTEAYSEWRICTECGDLMVDGYCIDDGCAYYCSDECLHKNYTEEEWIEMYDDGDSDCYWTQWY